MVYICLTKHDWLKLRSFSQWQSSFQMNAELSLTKRVQVVSRDYMDRLTEHIKTVCQFMSDRGPYTAIVYISGKQKTRYWRHCIMLDTAKTMCYVQQPHIATTITRLKFSLPPGNTNVSYKSKIDICMYTCFFITTNVSLLSENSFTSYWIKIYRPMSL